MSTKYFIGIDFGTTNTSVVQIYKDELGYKKQILGEDDGTLTFASILAIDSENSFDFGNKVKNNREFLSENAQVISSFKSLLGTNKKIKINNSEYSPVQIVAKYFECLKNYILKKYNISITDAVLSFPVGFSPEARRDLKNAAKLAKINVISLISESTSAYLATMDLTKGLPRVMVIDWGGGTLDISILENEDSKLKELAVYGEKIGGDDIDKELAERMHAELNRNMSDVSKRVPFSSMQSEQRDKMIAYCEKAKIQISEDCEDYPITIRNYGNYGTKTITLTNEKFESIIKPIIKNYVLKTINTALERAKITKDGVDAVLIAGGSSNLRLFAEAIENIFGEDKIIRPDDFQFISAIGAARIPFIGGNFKLNDDIGIVMSDNTVFPLLKKDIDGVGSKSNTYTFSLVEDSPDAHFIISNGNGSVIYDKIDVPTKGFLNERLTVNAEIDCEQIAVINIGNDFVPEQMKKAKKEINKLTFYYDLTGIEN